MRPFIRTNIFAAPSHHALQWDFTGLPSSHRRHGPQFGDSAGGRWAIEYESSRRLRALLAEHVVVRRERGFADKFAACDEARRQHEAALGEFGGPGVERAVALDDLAHPAGRSAV
jgi:hypothetical protein